MDYRRATGILLLLLLQTALLTIKTVGTPNQDIVFNFKTLDDMIPLNGFIALKVYNDTFSEFYEVVNGETRIPYNYTGLEASLIWIPLNLMLLKIGRILDVNLSEPLVLNLNIKNAILRCYASNINISNIRLYLKISHGNLSKTWEMYKGTLNLTIPSDFKFNYSIIYPFFGNNFTVSTGILNIDEGLPLRLNVTDVKGIRIRLNKAVNNVVIELTHNANSLLMEKVDENGTLEISFSRVLPSNIENCYWRALYDNKEVGRRPFNETEREIVLNLDKLYLSSLNLIDSDGNEISLHELELYLNGTKIENPVVQLTDGNYVLTVKLKRGPYGLNIATDKTSIVANQDANITIKCYVRRIRGIQAGWLISVINNQPIFLQYSDNMLLPFGIFSMYSDNCFLGYLNNSEAGLRIVWLPKDLIIKYEPSVLFNMPLLIALQIFSLIFINILLIKWYRSKRE